MIDAIRQKEKERDAIKKTLDAIDEEILTYRLWLEAHGIKLPDSSALTVTTPKQVVAPPTQTTSATPVGGSQQNDVPPVIEPVTEQKSGEKQEEASAAALSAPAGPAQREIAEATRKLWPPNGIVPLDLGATALWEVIGKLNSDEAAAKSKTSGKKEISHDPPSVDSCTRFLEKQRGQAKRN